MSLYDKASLIMTPSGVKAEKLYSHKPHNGNGDFTHDRNLGTATRVNKDGLIETVAADVPRLDYPIIDGVVQDCPALLLEPSRTNYVQYSEDISSLTATNSPTITTNIAVAPDGNNTADGIQDTTGGNFKRITQNSISVSSNSTVTGSVFIKKETSETNYAGMMFDFTGGTRAYSYVAFDAVNGLAINLAQSSITPSYINVVNFNSDWWRLEVTATDTGSNTTLSFGYYATLSLDFSGTGVGIGSVRTIWGMQLEQASYPTSYIPNDGTTATITRNADVCDSAGTSAEFNDSEGVLYAEIAALDNDSGFKSITINSGSTYNRILLSLNADDAYYGIVSGGYFQAFDDVSINSITSFNKLAVIYRLNDFALWINGFEVLVDVSGSIPIGLNQIDFNKSDGTDDFYGRTKELAVFNEALTDSELEALTSWDSFNDMAVGQEYTIR